MRAADAHLTPQELELLLFGAADSSNWDAGGALAPEAQQHLKGCAVCQAVVERYRNAEEALKGLESGNNATDRGQGPSRQQSCPAEATWLSLAAGLLNQDETARHVAHAAICDWCGPMLKEAMQDLAQSVTPEEQQALAQLPTASADWQREMAKKLAARSGSPNAASETTTFPGGDKEGAAQRKSRRVFEWWPRIALAGAAVALAAIACVTWLKTREPDVNQLLTQAYTEQRTIELRMPRAKYGPMRVKRGASGRSSFSKPSSLLLAEPLIRRRLDAHPDSPQWLSAEGWAELLEGEFSPAIQSFKRALDKQPGSAELMRDAAVAYFERGESEGRDSDYREAVELLNKSLAAKPDDPIALFNRAVVYEHLSFYNDAVADWKSYLQLDSTSEWSEDAKRRLDESQKKLKQHGESSTQPLLTPQAFVRDIGSDDTERWTAADGRIEAYLDQAVTHWLPQAFPTKPTRSGRSQEGVTVRGLRLLARILEKRHRDLWLRDLLAVPSGPSTPLALQELSKAAQGNLAGESAQALGSALAAKHLFLLAGNKPGVARAQLEQVHALQRAQKGDLCWDASEGLSAEIAGHEYQWISVQLLMEQAGCRAKANDLDTAVALAEAALASAQESRFVDLQLRALAIAADIELYCGRPERAWKYNRQGLELYWQCPCAPLRGYSLYDNVEYIAEGSSQWGLARAAGIEAVTAIAATPNSTGEAMARFRLASTSKLLNRNHEAMEEFGRAHALFGARRGSAENHDYMLFSQSFFAELQIQNGEVDGGLALLLRLEPQLRQVANYLMPFHLYSALAVGYLKKQQFKESELAAANAIRIAEEGLSSIHSRSEKLAWRSETNGVYRVFLESYLRDRHDAEASLAFWEWYRAAPLRESGQRRKRAGRSMFDVRQPASVFVNNAGLKNAQALISKSRQGFVAYAQVPDGIVIWSLNGTRIESQWVPVAPDQLSAHVQRLIAYCSDPESDISKLKEEGRYLYAILIAPVEKLIQDRPSLVFELDGVLSRVPLEVLVDGGGRYLGETHAITVSLGMAFLARRSEPLSRTEKVLVVNPPSTAGEEMDLFPLPEADREAEVVASQFPDSRRLIGPQATLAAVTKALSGTTLLHFAGHAIVLGHRSGLLLAQEEGDVATVPPLWDAEAIQRLDLRQVKLVVLSSCSTEEAESTLGDDPDNVIGSFLRAGVSQVIASRWDLDSKFAAEYMKAFYSGGFSSKPIFADTITVAGSMSRESEYGHPHFWAAFAKYGNDR